MKPFVWAVLVLILALSLFPSRGLAGDERLKRLSPEHRSWLEEEVVYIILEREREIFLRLESVEERERFIQAFWRKRDPNPATPQNEFQEEHYRRIEYANQFLGRETFLPGWKTDRGQMYIILGEPREMQRFDGYNELVASQLWFYQGDPNRGLPAFFYLLFYKRNDVGEYELYSPVIDGPNDLLHGPAGAGGEPQEAVQALRQISSELAHASLSFDLSEPVDLTNPRPSLGSDILMARIYDSPKRAIRPDYAEAWLNYGKRVSAEYSFNFIPSRSIFAVLAGPEATAFVCYSIEVDPENFSIETDEDHTKYYTTLDISLEVRDKQGTLVLANDKEVYLELSPSRMEQVQASPFAYQDDFPLVPGEYNISVILRNRVLKQYTVAETDLRVEPISSKPTLSDIVLGYGLEEMRAAGAEEGELRTFQIGTHSIHPASQGIFSLGETVYLMMQVVGASPDHRLEFTLLNGEEKLEERSSVMSDYLGGPVIERFPFLGMSGGRYSFRVRLLEPSGSVVAERTAKLQVSPRTAIPRPWVQRRSFNTGHPGLLALARGDQLLNQKRFAAARKELETAVSASKGELPQARWRLALVLIQSGDGKGALELLAPIEKAFPKQYAVVAGLGFAFHLQKDFPKALGYLEQAMTLRPPDTLLLNVLGDCYQKMGNTEKATESFERSLELNPDQKLVKDLLASLATNK